MTTPLPEPVPRRGGWTRAQVEQLGLHTDVPSAASILGMGRSTAYDLIRTDRFPVPVFHFGRRLRVPIAPLLAVLDGTYIGHE